MGILTLIERVIDMMDKNKLAQLDSEQLQEISELEAKIGVTLVAYDSMATLDETPPPSPS
ncbi:MAG: hypothetical protein WBG45_06415 [Paenisporosarcina sp.]|jgi:hypothetical protein